MPMLHACAVGLSRCYITRMAQAGCVHLPGISAVLTVGAVVHRYCNMTQHAEVISCCAFTATVTYAKHGFFSTNLQQTISQHR